MVSYNVPLRYVGTYQLDPSGQVRTTDLTITGNPRTYRKFEQKMAKMKMAGQYAQQQDTLNVHIETFNSQQGRWWSKGQRALTRATKRRTYVFGAKGTQDGRAMWAGRGDEPFAGAGRACAWYDRFVTGLSRGAGVRWPWVERARRFASSSGVAEAVFVAVVRSPARAALKSTARSTPGFPIPPLSCISPTAICPRWLA